MPKESVALLYLWGNRQIKKSVIAFMAILMAFSFNSFPVEAALKLQVTYKVALDTTDLTFHYSPTNLADSVKDVRAKATLTTSAKSAATKAKLIKACKTMDGYGSRLKVTNANGGTAGLANLNSVVLGSVRITRNFQDTPDYTDEESAALDEIYPTIEDYPDYISEGYSYYEMETDCFFAGTVAITSSNAYTIYVNGARGPEYSNSELANMKWKVTLIDN